MLKLVGIVILIVLAVLAAFAVLNWPALGVPVALSLLVATVDMPLGLLLLGALALLATLFGLYVLLLRSALYAESRRLSQDLAAQRELADKAEASRFTELSAHLDREIAGLRELIAGVQAQASARAAATETSVQQAVSDATNSLAACIGQVDDKLDRALGRG